MNLFIASELTWPEVGLTLRQETRYPDKGRARLTFACRKPVELRLKLRHPGWANSGFEIKVNGLPQPSESLPGSYAVVPRIWRDGDTVEITMPFRLRTEGLHDNPRRVAFLYGPLVLCAETRADTLNERPYPALVADEGYITAGLEPIPGQSGAFTASAEVLHPSAANDRHITLSPIYLMHGSQPYIVYWNALTPTEWQTEQAQARALQARTVDRVLPGNEPRERSHQVRGERTATGGESWRHAVDGGWFSWEMRILPRQPQELRVKYWGDDAGGREFDILVDDEKVATQKLDRNCPAEL